MTTIESVRTAFRRARAERERFLAENGWVFDGDFPDRRSRYVKKFGRREMAMPAGGAFALERKLREN